jgi:hypothetical protein
MTVLGQPGCGCLAAGQGPGDEQAHGVSQR